MGSMTPESQFWRAYALAVLDALGNPTLGSDEKLFVASVVDRGINAGAIVPYALTNRDIQNTGDVLLDVSDPLYETSSNNRYSQRLLDYLLHALPTGGNASAESEYKKALKADKDAHKEYQDQYQADIKEYNADTDPSKGSFNQWAANNDTFLVNLFNSVTDADGAFDQASQDYFGPDGAQLTIYRNNLRSAVDGNQLVAGINMEASDASFEQLQQMAQQQQSGNGKPWPPASTIYYVPVFDLDNLYAEQLDQWASSPGKQQSSTVKMSQGSSFDMTQLGFSSSSNTDFNLPWISWGSQSSTTTSSRAYTSKDSSADVSVSLNFTNISTFSIGPGGKWNVDAHSLYPNTDKNFSGVGTWALPSKLLCASGVGLTITFSNAAKSEFDTDWSTSSQSSDGGVSIFGFHFGTSSSSSSSSSTDTHDATWSSDSGTLTITPQTVAQTCSLLGVIGTTVTV